MPDRVPMHYNMAGEIDRWGSKYESFVFPALILAFCLFWHLMIRWFEKKAEKAVLDRERAEAESNARVMTIAGLSVTAVFGVLQLAVLYISHTLANGNGSVSGLDVGRVSCLLLGVLFIVLGNFLPKTRKNRAMGVRVKWSLYNDITWRKSNRFGAFALSAAGILTIVTSLTAGPRKILPWMFLWLTLALVLTLVYAYNVYRQEIVKGGSRND